MSAESVDVSPHSVVNVDTVVNSARVSKTAIAVIILCGCIMLLDGYDFGIVSNASPLMIKEWNVNTAQFGIVFSVATFGWMIGAIVFGGISDRIGRKKTLIIGAAIFTVGTLFVMFTHSVDQISIVRFISGIGVGGAVPVAMVLTSEFSPEKSRAKFVTIMFSGFVIGQTLGAYIAAAMMPVFGWRSLFLLGFIVPAIIIVVIAFFLPESARWLVLHEQGGKNRPALEKICKRIDPSLQIDANTEFVAVVEKKDKGHLKDLFEGRFKYVTPLLWLWYLCSSLGLFFIQSWLPQILVLKGLTAAHASAMVGTAGLFGIAGTILVGFYLDKAGFKWGFLWPLVAIVCIVCIGGVSATAMVLFWICANGLFMNGGHSILTAFVPNVYPVKIRAQGSGVANAIARIGSIIGPYIGGVLIAMGMPMNHLFYLIAIPFVLAAGLAAFQGRQYDNYFAPLYRGQLADTSATDDKVVASVQTPAA